MNRDFIAIKTLAGELKISHKKSTFGLTVTTKEIVMQKPHINYHILLEDVLGLVPFDDPQPKRVSFHQPGYGYDVTFRHDGQQLYKLFVSKATVHNRSGVFPLQTAEFIMPIHRDLLQAISKYGGIHIIGNE